MGEIRLLIILLHIDCLGWVAFRIGLLEEFFVSAGSEPAAACSQIIVQFLIVGFGFLSGDIFSRVDSFSKERELASEMLVGRLNLNRKCDTY